MIYLLLCIISSTGIFFSFKLISHLKANNNIAITFNYIIATILSYLFSYQTNEHISNAIHSYWFIFAIATGVLFIAMFFVINLSTQTAGLAITTSANKTSMILPIALSIYLEKNNSFQFLDIIVLVLAVLSVILMSYKREKKLITSKLTLLLPFIIFLGAGIIDSLIKYAQEFYIVSSLTATFNFYVFLIAAIIGLAINIIRFKVDFKHLKTQDFLTGGLLGVANYFSLHFLIEALNYTKTTDTMLNSASVFGLNNIGIVLITSILGVFLFKEQLEKQNYIGIFLSVLTILIITIGLT